MQDELTAADIKIGHTYSAKSRKKVGLFPALVNDRQVKWIDRLGHHLQYDSPTVSDGRRFPVVKMEAFLKWARADVTNQMPPGKWRDADAH